MDPLLLLAAAFLGLVAFVLTYRFPEWWLAIGCLFKFTADQYLFLSQIGTALIAAALVLAMLHSSRVSVVPRGLAVLAVVLPVWLAARTFAVPGGEDASQFLMCAAAATTAVWCARARRPLATALAGATALFLGLSLGLGQTDASGDRFEGISGNPNRLVSPILMGLPAVVHVAMTPRHRLLRVGAAAVAVLIVLTALRTQSSQGIAAMVVIAACLAYGWYKKSPTRLPAAVFGVGVAAALAWSNRERFQFSEDEEDAATWSGRIPLFKRAWEVIQDNALFGTGLTHFDAGEHIDRSSHNVTLSIGLISGIPGMAVWLLLLGGSLVLALRALGKQAHWAAGAAAVAILSVTQTLEIMPLMWAILAHVCGWAWVQNDQPDPDLDDRDDLVVSTGGSTRVPAS